MLQWKTEKIAVYKAQQWVKKSPYILQNWRWTAEKGGASGQKEGLKRRLCFSGDEFSWAELRGETKWVFYWHNIARAHATQVHREDNRLASWGLMLFCRSCCDYIFVKCEATVRVILKGKEGGRLLWRQSVPEGWTESNTIVEGNCRKWNETTFAMESPRKTPWKHCKNIFIFKILINEYSLRARTLGK